MNKSSLIEQARDKNKGEVLKLLKKKLPKESIDLPLGSDDENQYSFLQFAALFDQTAAIEAALEYGAKIDAPEPLSQNTALHIACRVSKSLAQPLGNVASVKLLLRLKANPKCRNENGVTPLHYAAFHAGQAVVDALLDHDVSLLHEVDNNQETPLHTLLAHEFDEEVQNAALYLLERYTTLPEGLLHLAILNGYVAVFEALLAKGANVLSKDKQGNTLFHVGLMQDHREAQTMIELTFENISANDVTKFVNEQNLNGDTALHLIFRSDEIDLDQIQYLLNQGARTDLANGKQETVQSLCMSLFNCNLDALLNPSEAEDKPALPVSSEPVASSTTLSRKSSPSGSAITPGASPPAVDKQRRNSDTPRPTHRRSASSLGTNPFKPSPKRRSVRLELLDLLNHVEQGFSDASNKQPQDSPGSSLSPSVRARAEDFRSNPKRKSVILDPSQTDFARLSQSDSSFTLSETSADSPGLTPLSSARVPMLKPTPPSSARVPMLKPTPLSSERAPTLKPTPTPRSKPSASSVDLDVFACMIDDLLGKQSGSPSKPSSLAPAPEPDVHHAVEVTASPNRTAPIPGGTTSTAAASVVEARSPVTKSTNKPAAEKVTAPPNRTAPIPGGTTSTAAASVVETRSPVTKSTNEPAAEKVTAPPNLTAPIPSGSKVSAAVSLVEARSPVAKSTNKPAAGKVTAPSNPSVPIPSGSTSTTAAGLVVARPPEAIRIEEHETVTLQLNPRVPISGSSTSTAAASLVEARPPETKRTDEHDAVSVTVLSTVPIPSGSTSTATASLVEARPPEIKRTDEHDAVRVTAPPHPTVPIPSGSTSIAAASLVEARPPETKRTDEHDAVRVTAPPHPTVPIPSSSMSTAAVSVVDAGPPETKRTDEHDVVRVAALLTVPIPVGSTSTVAVSVVEARPPETQRTDEPVVPLPPISWTPVDFSDSDAKNRVVKFGKAIKDFIENHWDKLLLGLTLLLIIYAIGCVFFPPLALGIPFAAKVSSAIVGWGLAASSPWLPFATAALLTGIIGLAGLMVFGTVHLTKQLIKHANSCSATATHESDDAHTTTVNGKATNHAHKEKPTPSLVASEPDHYQGCGGLSCLRGLDRIVCRSLSSWCSDSWPSSGCLNAGNAQSKSSEAVAKKLQ